MPHGRSARHFQRMRQSWQAAREFGPVYHDYRALYSDVRDLAGNYYYGEGSKGFSRYVGLADEILAMLPGDKLTWRLEEDHLSPEALRAAAYKVAYRNGFKLHVAIPMRRSRHVVITRL